MKILVIDEEFPYPPNSGKRIRSFNLLKRIAEKHSLTYLAYGTEDSDSYQQLKLMNMNPVAVDPQVSKKRGLIFYIKLFLNLFSNLPYVVTSHYSKLFQEKLNDMVSEFYPDLILCEWTPYAIFIKDHKKIKRIIASHNVEAKIWERYYNTEKNCFKKWYIGIQWAKLQKFERDAFHSVEGATAVSELEADEIHSLNHRLLVTSVDNGVDLDYFSPTGRESKPNNLVFVGSMDWRPNQDAALYFAEKIFPILKKKAPEIQVYFVGREPSPQISSLNNIEGITVTGEVDDVRPYIEDGAVYIVPLRIGGGTRLKILDAMAMKKAVVSTSVGAEGLNLTDGENILLADSPIDFSDKIITLLNNPELRKRLGENGRNLVEQSYGWDSIADRLEKFLKKVVEEQ